MSASSRKAWIKVHDVVVCKDIARM